MDKVDKHWITDEFLMEYFYDRKIFQKVEDNPKQSRIALLEDKYTEYKKDINETRAKSGFSPLSDPEIRLTLEKAKGRVYLPKV